MGKPSTPEVTLQGHKDGSNIQMMFTVPVVVSKYLVHLQGRTFRCELVPEGVLFRPVEQEPKSVEVPAWVKEGEQ